MGSNAQDNCEVVCDPHDLACYFCSRQANSLSCVSSYVNNTFHDRAPAPLRPNPKSFHLRHV